jgi:hypothetical protein
MIERSSGLPTIPTLAHSTGLPTFLPTIVGVPIIHADIIIGNLSYTPRYAILGPDEQGLVQQNHLLQLANGDQQTVVLRKNHGSTAEKPTCSAIEAEYIMNGIMLTRILLATNYLVHSSFQVEDHPNPRYMGNAAPYRMMDRMIEIPNPMHYGVLPMSYHRVPEPDSEDEEDNDYDNWEHEYDEIQSKDGSENTVSNSIFHMTSKYSDSNMTYSSNWG